MTSSIEELPVVKDSSGAVDVGQDGQALLSKGDGTYCWGSGGYGMVSKTTTFNGDVITEIDGNGYTRTTTFNSDGSITEQLANSSGTVATKTTVFNSDGSISETIG